MCELQLSKASAGKEIFKKYLSRIFEALGDEDEYVRHCAFHWAWGKLDDTPEIFAEITEKHLDKLLQISGGTF